MPSAKVDGKDGTKISVRRATRPPRGPQGPRVPNGSREARKVAAAVLEVLAGERTPQDAAGAIGVSPPHYYTLEGRALQGLVAGCERRDKSPRTSPEREAEKLRKELVRLKKDLARHQALARAAQRAVGLVAAKPVVTKRDKAGRKRRRRPTVRALKAAHLLQSGLPRKESPEVSPSASPASGEAPA